jgi:S-methylmethionine-dependent homocysteine/selenocysteine methylase
LCPIGSYRRAARKDSGVGYRHRLPQLSGKPFLTDGGMETDLIYNHGLDLPLFAAFVLLRHAKGLDALSAYYASYIAVAKENGVGLLLDTATWRANPDWGTKLGYSSDELAEANRSAVRLVDGVRAGADSSTTPILISGCIGPRGDGYRATAVMNSRDAAEYHRSQIEVFRDTAADMIDAVTMTYAEEAAGIVNAAAAAQMPVVISFTLETDGRLPSGQPLKEAIEQVDAETDSRAAYFMINCAHPTHFAHVFDEGGRWRARLAGLRANASMKSHAELDESSELDAGDPADLAARYMALRGSMPALHVLGGCCGTDARHIEAICAAWLATPTAR